MVSANQESLVSGIYKTSDFMSDKIRAVGRNSRLTEVAFPPGFNPTPDQVAQADSFGTNFKNYA
jgi:hypothetical protein